MSKINVRMAPSPTGLLHIGNIRAALFNWLFARRHGGSFMLRLDDTDKERSRDELALYIERDLRWLGLEWDRFARQSDRLARYDEVLAELKAKGHAYACYETPEELALKRKTQLGRGLPPLYDRSALKLTAAEHAAFAAEGRKPHWRFLLTEEDTVWHDAVQGRKQFPSSAVSDPVLVREDGVPLYTFCSVVDDVDFGISHVIRGEDHVTNTAVQLQIWQAITALPCPVFAHFPLLVSGDGIEMSKRLGTLSIASMRDEMELEAMAINALVARLGTSDPVVPATSLDELAADFALEKVSHGTPKFEIAELQSLSARILHQTDFDAVKDRLTAMNMPEIDAAFWNNLRPNLNKVSEIKAWWQVARGTVTPKIADPDFAQRALALLPPEPWDHATWAQWTEAVKRETGRKGKELFMPLRLAITGQAHGPELQYLLPQIGAQKVKARLTGSTA
jgi:glutamyl-tRNA synthetase